MYAPEGWVYEDALPEAGVDYAVWFRLSRVIDGVRMGPPPEEIPSAPKQPPFNRNEIRDDAIRDCQTVIRQVRFALNTKRIPRLFWTGKLTAQIEICDALERDILELSSTS